MIHLTQDEHQRLLSQGKQLFQTITTSRTSSLEIPSYLIKTTTYTHNQLPIVTKSQIEIHRLTQENKALQAHIATFATTTTSPSNSPQRRPHKQLRNLDKEGALHQENNTLRTQLRKSTAYETHTTVKIQELETKNKHLEAKLQLFRIELQRKDTIKNGTTINNSTSSTTPVSSTLSKQAELNQTENVRLRRLLAERNELTIHLKNDLERVAKERLVMRRTIKNLKSQIYIRVDGRISNEGGVRQGGVVDGMYGEDLPKESSQPVDYEDENETNNNTNREEGSMSFTEIWSEVLWGKS